MEFLTLTHGCGPGQGGQGLCSPPQPRASRGLAELTKTLRRNQCKQQPVPPGHV